MEEDIYYYGLSLPELLAIAIVFQAVKIFRSTLCDDHTDEHVSSDSCTAGG